MKEKRTIGRFDRVNFPEFGLEEIDVKIDTGAYGCSIHCNMIEELMVDGQKQISFQLLDESHQNYNHKEFRTSNYAVKTVKSSTGVPEERFFIETTILLFDKPYAIKLSLTDRSEMKFPVLLGRTLLNGNFIVDTSRTNLSFKQQTINK